MSTPEQYELAKEPRTIEIRQSQEVDQLFAAFVRAQANIGPAMKNQQNTFNNSKYADLAAVNEAFRDAFAEQELGVMQFPFTRSGTVERSYREEITNGNNRRVMRPVYFEDGSPMMETVPVIYVLVRTRVVHSSGQWLEQDLEIPVVMGNNPAQDVGKVITYGQRYAVRAVAGVATEDEDAEGLAGANYGNGTQPTQPAPPARTARRQGPSKPQSNGDRMAFHLDRLRESENMTTLKALFAASYRQLEKDGTPEDLAELEKVKDEVKATLEPEQPADQAEPAAQEEAPEQATEEQAESKPKGRKAATTKQ